MNVDVLIIPQCQNDDLTLPPLRIQTLSYASDEGSLSVYQNLVGGYIDVLPAMCNNLAAMVIHDEGKFHPDCHPNIWATRIASDRIDVDDYIAGTVVLVDVNPGPAGETLGVTRECVRWLLSKGVPIQGAVEFLSPSRE